VSALRASDAERQRVADRLREACLEGRLDADELDERLAVAYGARTRPELAALLDDLPAPAPAGAVALPAPSARTWARTRTVVLWLLATLVALLTVAALVLPTWTWVVLALVVGSLLFTLVMVLAGIAPFVAVGVGAVWAARRLLGDGGAARRGGLRRGPEHPGF